MTSLQTAPWAAHRAADRLADAMRSGVPVSPVRDLIGRDDVALAYAVQQLGTARRLASGARLVGRKIGLTSPAVQKQLDVDQPDFGVLFADMDVTTTPVADRPVLLQPKVEAEIAFILASDLDSDRLDATTVRAAVHHAVAALEIVDSRIENWDISFGDTVADNASSGWFVLGARTWSLDDIDPVDVTMQMSIDGALASTGAGEACMGDPLNALAWLARTARTFGEPLRAGEIVLSGALGPMAPLYPGSHVHADLGIAGTVEFTWKETE
ncbi:MULTISPECIES: 2-keto-4-pentenoate hydratase [Nocardia]|uniref:2-keto-4-pentenoate hydratase n=1 Tax=Nocardia TaxID=1817 RepID=UPI000D68DC3C|nr:MULTISPECIES: fumarylacetoacetate hydrolase family protein [Nocardia]